ncbi:MAG: 2'-O-glycosyltransferase CruG [Prochlorotrichaceae cyanobacterium]
MVSLTAAVPPTEWEQWLSVAAFLVLALQIPAVLILFTRLLQGPGRRPPLTSLSVNSTQVGQVSVIVPTLNEVDRLHPCLEGLTRQGYEVREILVVDSRSQDGTQDLVKAASLKDPRIRLLEDDPLPPGWVGRPWALHNGFLRSSPESEWILGIDADTQPDPTLAATLLRVAEQEQFDLITLSPKFILKFPGEWWLQPALLMTLVYRFGPAGGKNPPDRVMANGQCCFCRRSLLVEMEGYSGAAQSFCDDVTLVRQAAQRGAKVGFLDGANLLKVRMYEGLQETWQEWGRSLDLKDATTVPQLLGDLALLKLVQGAPLFLTVLLGIAVISGHPSLTVTIAFALNLILVIFRFALQAAIQSSYDFESPSQGRWLFWLAPFADPLAVARIFLSAAQTPRQWRGRTY